MLYPIRQLALYLFKELFCTHRLDGPAPVNLYVNKVDDQGCQVTRIWKTLRV